MHANWRCNLGLNSVIFHDQETVSLGLRKLATMKKYSRFLNFYQMKNPPPARLRELGIDRLSKLVTFLPDPIHLVEPDSTEPIDKVYYDEAFIFDKLKRYLDAMISHHARYLQTPPEVRSERDLGRYCLERRADLCLFFVVDKRREERNDNLVDKLNDMVVLHRHGRGLLAPSYFDIGCFPQLKELFRFGDNLVPLLVVYRKSTRSFLRSEHKFNVYDGRSLIDSVLASKVDSRFKPSDLRLGPSACEPTADVLAQPDRPELDL